MQLPVVGNWSKAQQRCKGEETMAVTTGEMKKSDSNAALIRKFFSTPEKPVSLTEVKALTSEEREELGEAIRATLSE